MRGLEVDKRVHERNPELEDDDIVSAWENALSLAERSGGDLRRPLLVAVGYGTKGRMLEMVADVLMDGAIHVFHAMTPPSKKRPLQS